MYCRICGVTDDEVRIQYYPNKRQALCRHCAKGTPSKVGRIEFDRLYWAGATENDPPESTRREFYSDYLASRHSSVASYLAATTSKY